MKGKRLIFMYGSLTNRLNERQASDEIKVGVGATI